jgi:Matrixin
MRRSGVLRAGCCVAAIAVSVLVAVEARAFCRTMTCPLPPDFSPQPDACVPDDFASYCASLQPSAKPLPVWWRNACVGYDIQQDASSQVPYATAAQMFAAAFTKWTTTVCPDSSADAGAAPSRVSIDVRDLGPVACGEVQYNSNQGNQHVIIFHDDVWPHNDANNTLGLTTVTYDPDTGEIYDADMEINATVPLTLTDPVPADGYDFQSIITHECGHFLGMAHSGDDRATMFAHYAQGSTYMRVLTDDDVSGICSIYLPDGDRVVDPSATSDGGDMLLEDSCDPTPRHGFSTQCASATHACSVGAVGPAGADASAAAWAGALVLGTVVGVVVRPLRAKRRRRADRGV